MSYGTIKGMITFSMVKDILQSGGYLLVDEIEIILTKKLSQHLCAFLWIAV